jgi:hydroxyacylglutathione hydrolase
LRSLPENTRLYCGHEYTERNLGFAQSIEPESDAIAERIRQVQALRARGEPSVPSTLADELATNPFLRWDEPGVIAKARALGAGSDDPAAVFAELRRAKDTF